MLFDVICVLKPWTTSWQAEAAKKGRRPGPSEAPLRVNGQWACRWDIPEYRRYIIPQDASTYPQSWTSRTLTKSRADNNTCFYLSLSRYIYIYICPTHRVRASTASRRQHRVQQATFGPATFWATEAWCHLAFVHAQPLGTDRERPRVGTAVFDGGRWNRIYNMDIYILYIYIYDTPQDPFLFALFRWFYSEFCTCWGHLFEVMFELKFWMDCGGAICMYVGMYVCNVM